MQQALSRCLQSIDSGIGILDKQLRRFVRSPYLSLIAPEVGRSVAVKNTTDAEAEWQINPGNMALMIYQIDMVDKLKRVHIGIYV